MPLALLPRDAVAVSSASSRERLAVGVGEGSDVSVGPGGERADGGLGRGSAGLGERGPEARLLEEVGGLSEPSAGEVGRGGAQGGARGGVEELAVVSLVVGWFFVGERVGGAR